MIDAAACRKLSQQTDRNITANYFVRLTESTFSNPPYTLYRVKHSREEKTVNAGGQMVLKRREVFRIYQTDITNSGMTVTPKIKDKIVDLAGIAYIIIEAVDVEAQGQVFACRCQKAVEQ